MTKPLIKLSRSAMRSWTIGHLKTKQDGLCAICKKPIDLQVMGNKSDYVVDHCHETGEIRGVLHRSCNSAEGKVTNAAGRWGAKSTKYSEVIPYLKSLVEYLEYHQENPSSLLYPDHKSDEQKQDLAKKRRREADARRRAKARMQELKETTQDQE